MKYQILETDKTLCLIMGMEQYLMQKLEGQSYEIWEVKQGPGQGMVLQHQAQKSLLESPKQAPERAQKPKQKHGLEKDWY